MRQRSCGRQIFEESEKDYYILKVYICKDIDEIH